LKPGYRVPDTNGELIAVPNSAAQQAVVGCQENVYPAPLGAGQMQSVKGTETKRLEKRGALSRVRSRNHDHVGKYKQGGNVVSAFRIRVAADLDLKCGTADPGYLGLAYQAENTIDRFGPLLGYAFGSGRPSGGSSNRHQSGVSMVGLISPVPATASQMPRPW
jgi:hypothetical protein